jgi:hypothetical protein
VSADDAANTRTDENRTAADNPAADASPDLPPPTMPASARRGEPPPAPARATSVRSDGELAAGGIPAGTGPEAPAAEGTAEAALPAEGVHDPDIDEDEPALASRPLVAREPREPGQS